MTHAIQIPVEIHAKFLPLLNDPHTYADMHGGRYGMKTEQAHKCALIRAIQEPLRVLGVRETLQSTQASSHNTLVDIIHAHEMASTQNGPFEVLRDTIRRSDGDRVVSEFSYVGVRENVRDKKSLANIDLVIFDEAGKCSKDSLTVFLPTVVRKPGCRVWLIWNPELITDPIYQFLKVPPPGTIHIETSYKDNPWLGEEARNLVEHCRRTDPDEYEHIYLGKPISQIKGAIFADELKRVDAEGRICSVPYDPTRPVHTAWDLGFGDPTCIWFVQVYDGFLNFIDFAEATKTLISDHVIALQQKGYMYGTDHLPHDAIDNIIHSKLIGNTDKSLTIPVLMGKAGRKVQIAPKLLKPDALNAAHTLFPLCRFDAVKCADGIQGLRHYQWDREMSAPDKPDAKLGARKPLHDWASHRADAFMTAAVSIKPNHYIAPAAGRQERVVAEI